MLNLGCVLAGITRLLGPLVLLILWHKKTGARFYPALIAYAVCFPVFIIGAGIRSGFPQDDPIAFYVPQGILFGILEEGAKYLVLRFHLASYDSTKDAVPYGIGHSCYELFASGLSCFGLIGTGNAPSDIFLAGVYDTGSSVIGTVSLTILIHYGIHTGRSKITLPAAILLHAIGNMGKGLLLECGLAEIAFALDLLLTAGECFAAYRCRKAAEDPFADL